MLLFLVSVALFGTCMSVDIGCSPRHAGYYHKPDLHDCSNYYLCSNGRRYNFSCGNNVWSQEVKTCVAVGSQWDKCSVKSPVILENPCSNPDVTKAPNEDNCAMYYDCQAETSKYPLHPPRMECDYPMLFNDVTNRCEPYMYVKCGEYRTLGSCQGLCPPCYLSYPNCEGRKDGLNAWEGREWQPHFAVCKDERFVFRGQCGQSVVKQIFNPEKLMCEEFKK